MCILRDMNIRSARNEDAAAVRHLVFGVLAEYGLNPDPTGTDADLDDIEASYLTSGGIFDLVEDDSGRLIATVGLFPRAPGVVELRKMYVAKDARGQGLGKRLLEHAIARARERNFRRIELETAGALVEAIGLYTGRGFTPMETSHLAARCDRAFGMAL
jgi:GNAT superfamily N-acetyltransferase